MSKLLLLFLGLFIAAAAIDVAAAAPLQYDKAASRASETSTRIAAALVLPELSHISPPSDPRICLTNILMTYFSESDVTLLWTEPQNPPSWWECGNCLEVLCSDGLAELKMPLFLLPPEVYDRSVNGTPWSPGYSKEFFSVTSIDDSLWWCIALLRVHTRNESFPYDTSLYLSSSIHVWEMVLQHAWDDVFGGGVWWTDDHSHGLLGKGYKNAITNELFLYASTSLYKATGNETFLKWAHKEAAWFLKSGMINREYLVNDGLDKYGHNNNGTTWSYNQGVILGGLVDLYNITGDAVYLSLAMNISGAAMRTLTDKIGVFSEICDGGTPGAPPCVLNDDARIFKGIFVRYLGHLIPALHRCATSSVASNSALSPVTALAHLSKISEFVKFNFDHVSADSRNSATWATCGAIPMPRPSPGAVWQSARESVFAGYTSTLSTLDLVIVHAQLQQIEMSNTSE